MSVGRFYDDVELEYSRKFDGFATMFGSRKGTNNPKYLNLIQKAIDRGSAVTEDELVAMFGQSYYDNNKEVYDNPDDWL